MKKNIQTLAELVASYEGGKVQLPIGQVKEVLRIVMLIRARDMEYDMLCTKYGEAVAKREAKKYAKR